MYCPLCHEIEKQIEMVTVEQSSELFSGYRGKLGYQYYFFAECPRSGAKLLAYGRG